MQKTGKNFSPIAIDHAHRQNNKCLKGDGGVIGWLCWMVEGPEVARLVNDFQYDVDIIKQRKKNNEDKKQHKQTESIQKAFKKQIDDLCQIFEEHGNPFSENSNDLIVIGARDIIDDSVITIIKTIIDIAKSQFETFNKERLLKEK